MDVLEQIYERARACPRKVAFPEAADEKIMQAAFACGSEGYIVPVLVGDEAELRNLAQERGYDCNVFRFADINDAELLERTASEYLKQPDIVLKEKGLKRRMQDPMYFAMALQRIGEVDVCFAGMEHSTGDVLIAGQMMIGLGPGVSVVSSIGLCDIPGFDGSEGRLLAVGDSAVCTDPTAEQLCDIAISSCETVSGLLGWEARCAMISYSTLGSGHGPLVDKVTEAVRLANEKRPDLLIDGEFQLDAAIDPVIAAKKVRRESAVAGRANVLIWPDLNVGNTAVKLIQRFGHADAYGPMLQGFRSIICDCSRSAPVSELKGNIIISAVRAAAAKKEAAV